MKRAEGTSCAVHAMLEGSGGMLPPENFEF